MEIHSTSVGRDAKDRLERTASRKPRSELMFLGQAINIDVHITGEDYETSNKRGEIIQSSSSHALKC
ncbi:hypothetical protein OUZ56_004466 [Daphnia magna]|uniref:Uncharacterized protein n=1 Tax=Daphnia magna TaxID=35525 RepID=A0ABQ9YPV4_9CRUS|nr:hypothetical protein OUZ56_004466 [Daphnia magna]